MAVSEALGEAFVEIRGRITQLAGDLSDAESLVHKRVREIGAKTSQVGRGLTAGLTLPIAAVGGAAIAAGLQFDEAFDLIRAGTGATGKDLEALEATFESVFAKVPDDAEAVATAIADINTRTGATGPTLERLALQLLTVSRITKTDLSGNIAASTRLFGDWSIASDDQSDALDRVFRVAQQTGIGVDGLMQQLVQFGAPLRQFNFSFEESAALLGKWEKEGVNTERILGALSIGLSNFAKQGLDAPVALQEFIIQLQQARTDSEATGMAIEIFGSRAGPDMAAAIREGRFAVSDLMSAIEGSGETIMGVAAETDGFAESWRQFKNELLLALKPLGESLVQVLDGLRPHLQGLAQMLAGLIGWFGNLSPTIQTVVLILGGLAAAAGPVLVVVGSLITAFTTIAPLFAAGGTAAAILGGALTVLTGPIGLVVAAVAGLIAAWMAWGDDITRIVSNVVTAVVDWLGPKIAVVWEPIRGLLESIGRLFAAFRDLVGAVFMKVVEVTAGAVAQVIVWLVDKLQPIFAPIGAAIRVVQAVFEAVSSASIASARALYEGVKTWLVDRFTAVVDRIRGAIDGITGMFQSMYEKVVGGSFVPDMVDGIAAQFGRLDSIMVSPTQAAVSGVEGLFSGLTSRVSGLMDGLMSNLTGSIQGFLGDKGIGGLLGGIAGSILPGVGNLLGGLVGKGIDALTGWIGGLFRGNSTKKARDEFAKEFGGDQALWTQLRDAGRDDLVHKALNVIGKDDRAANEAWMREVVQALEAAKTQADDTAGAMETIPATSETAAEQTASAWESTHMRIAQAESGLTQTLASEREARTSDEKVALQAKAEAYRQEIASLKRDLEDDMVDVASSADGTARSLTEAFRRVIDRDGIRGDIDGVIEDVRDLSRGIRDELGDLAFDIPVGFSVEPGRGGITAGSQELDIQWAATGGIALSPTIVGVGDAGPEALIPLDRLESMLEGGGSRSGDTPIVLHNHVFIGDQYLGEFVTESNLRNLEQNRSLGAPASFASRFDQLVAASVRRMGLG